MCPRRSALTRVRRALTTALVAVLAAVTGAPHAGAAVDHDVSTDPTGAHVVLVRGRIWVEVGARRGGGDKDTDPGGCRRRWVPAAAPYFLRKSRMRGGDIHPVLMPPKPTPEHRAYHVYCDGEYVTSVWLVPGQFGAAAVDPRAIAERLARDLPYPAATIGVSPAARGLTGLESWFWVEGYSGAPLTDAVEGFGILIEVEARAVATTWDFGDGSALARGTLGQAAPARSDVRHAFEHPSRALPLTLRATVRIDVRWRQDGGPWQPLPPVGRSATRAYAVAESRAALVR